MTNSSDSGDHHQAQAVPGRAVVGDAPSPPSAAAAAAASATAPSPPPPSASDAAVQPRARDSGSPDDPPPSGSPDDPPPSTETRGTGGRASGDDDDHSRILDQPAALSDGHIDAVLPASAGADPPVPPAQLDNSRSNERPTATDLDGPPPAPASAAAAAAAAPSTREQIAAASIENVHQGNGDNDEQIASAHEEMTALIEELMNAPLRVNEVPLPQPPALTAARYDQMDEDIKALLAIPPNVSEVPRPMALIAEDFSDMDEAIKQNVENANNNGSGMDPPLPQSQIAAFAEEMVEDEAEKKQAAPTTEAGDNTPSASLLVVPPTADEEETLQRAQGPPTPAVARAPSPPPMDRGRGPSNPRGQQQIPVRPPPPSMMPSSDEDPSTPSGQVPTLPRDPSAPMLEGTLAREMSIYDGVLVTEQTWMKKNKKYILGSLVGGLGVLFGGVVAATLSVSSNNGARPSESSSPSKVPSLLPTLVPSRSLDPSTSLRPTTSLHPSQIPSLPPSLIPTTTPSVHPTLGPSRSLAPSTSLRPSSTTTANPTPFCFGGEINILTDSCPSETSWNLVRIDTIGGISSTTVDLKGSPEEEGHHTYEACLERGDYEFAIFDSFGDGIDSPGYYSVAFDGMMIAQGGDFESEDKVSFSLPLPSPPPSESSSPSELPSASFQPSESTVPSQFPSLRPSVQPSKSFSPSTYWSTLHWSRQGLGFNGDASHDRFGEAVAFSADASTMAIGARGEYDNRPGYVKVYGREGDESSWKQRGDTLRGEANGDYFGRSLALSEDGTILSVGAPLHDSVGPYSGQVKVYEWNEAALDYVQIGDTLYGTASGDEFGWSLDISNDKILAVGADRSDANGFWSGQVMIYAWDDASSNFKQRGEAIDGDAAGDLFGYSVSLSGNGQKFAVGAPFNDSNGSNSGQVRIFEWNEATSNYEQLGDPLLGDAAGDRFGQSVSFSRDGTTVAIGAPDNSENGQYSGQVKVFAWDEAAANFEQIGQSLYGKASDDYFGLSVALSSEGKTLAVGAAQSYAGKPGYVEVYGWDEADREYKRLGQSLGGEASDDLFGGALALAGNGRDLAVGAPFNARKGTDSGRVEVFHIEL